MKKIVSFFGQDNETQRMLNKHAEQYAAELGFDYKWIPHANRSFKEYIQIMNEYDASIIDVERFDDRVFSQLNERHRLMVRFGVGYDSVDLKAASRWNIGIARTAGANASAVAEMALSLLLAVKRHIVTYHQGILVDEWPSLYAHELFGSTCGILGFGAIGQSFAKLLNGFACRVLVYDYKQRSELVASFGAELANLDQIFREADSVSIHLPLNQKTDGLVNADFLNLMKPGAVLVNTSRGKLICERDLIDALNSGALAGAGLDVFTEEPLPENSPLRKMENVVLTPHASGQTYESLQKTYEMAISHIDQFFNQGRRDMLLNRISE